MDKNGRHLETFSIPAKWSLRQGYGWSPDGMQIVFSAREQENPFGEDNWDLYLYDLNNRKIINLTNYPKSEYFASWSKRIFPVEPGNLKLTFWECIKSRK